MGLSLIEVNFGALNESFGLLKGYEDFFDKSPRPSVGSLSLEEISSADLDLNTSEEEDEEDGLSDLNVTPAMVDAFEALVKDCRAKEIQTSLPSTPISLVCEDPEQVEDADESENNNQDNHEKVFNPKFNNGCQHSCHGPGKRLSSSTGPIQFNVTFSENAAYKFVVEDLLKKIQKLHELQETGPVGSDTFPPENRISQFISELEQITIDQLEKFCKRLNHMLRPPKRNGNQSTPKVSTVVPPKNPYRETLSKIKPTVIVHDSISQTDSEVPLIFENRESQTDTDLRTEIRDSQTNTEASLNESCESQTDTEVAENRNTQTDMTDLQVEIVCNKCNRREREVNFRGPSISEVGSARGSNFADWGSPSHAGSSCSWSQDSFEIVTTEREIIPAINDSNFEENDRSDDIISEKITISSSSEESNDSDSEIEFIKVVRRRLPMRRSTNRKTNTNSKSTPSVNTRRSYNLRSRKPTTTYKEPPLFENDDLLVDSSDKDSESDQEEDSEDSDPDVDFEDCSVYEPPSKSKRKC